MRFQPRVYTTRREKWRDAAIGFFGWMIVNLVLVALYAFVLSQNPQGSSLQTIAGLVILAISCIALIVNIGGLIYFGLTRQFIALGILILFGAALLLPLLGGVALAAVCFTMNRSFLQ